MSISEMNVLELAAKRIARATNEQEAVENEVYYTHLNVRTFYLDRKIRRSVFDQPSEERYCRRQKIILFAVYLLTDPLL